MWNRRMSASSFKHEFQDQGLDRIQSRHAKRQPDYDEKRIPLRKRKAHRFVKTPESVNLE
jgi:hypothetical protein